MIRSIVVMLIVGGGLVAAVRSRYAALLVYLWFALFRPQEFTWGFIEELRLSLLVGFALVMPAILTGTFPNLTHPLAVGSVAFLITALLAQMNAFNSSLAWEWLTILATTITVSLLAITLTTSRQRFIALMAVIAGSLGFYTAKYGVGFIIRGGAKFLIGTGGMFGDNNDFALAGARIIFLLIAVAQNVRFLPIRLGFWAAVPLTVLGIVSTFSRGGFLALTCGGLVFLLLQRRRLLALGLTTAAVAMVLAAAPIPQSYFDRIRTIESFDEVGDGSALGRVHYWRVALMMAQRQPLGVGLKNFEDAYDRYDDADGLYGRHKTVHNTHLQVLAETGVMGFIVFESTLLYALWLAWRIRGRSRSPGLDADASRFLFTMGNALLASLVAFLVGGTFLSAAVNDLNWFTYALVAVLDRISLEMINTSAQAESSQAAAA